MQALNLQDNLIHEPFEDEQLQLMTANLLKIQRQITERDQIITESPKRIYQNSQESNTAETRARQMSQQIREKYQEYLAVAKLPTNHEQKLQYLLSSPLNLGTSIALFELLYYFRDIITEQILEQISDNCLHKIIESGNKLNHIQKCALLELIAICGVYREQTIAIVVEGMLEGSLDFLEGFLVLSNMGFRGLEILINLAREDFKETPMLILDHLARTEEILRQLLIPILIEDLSNSKSKGRQKEIILAILNRLNSQVSQCHQIFPILIELMQTNYNDRGFITSLLRSCGIEGEKILLKFLEQFPNNEKIGLPIINVLPWRAPTEPVLRIKVIEYTLGSNFLPGTLYQYEGKIEPSAFCFQDEDCCDSLCINARDFIAALNRMLANKIENFENQQNLRKGSLNNLKLFTLYEVIGKKQQEEQIGQISAQVIKSLTKSLSNPKPEIREASINALGLIGLPEAFSAVDEITKCLWDKDSRNRSMACWALSRLCESSSKKVINRLLDLLKDSFWKVRISACICLGNIVDQPYENVVEGLVRCLKDNSINKVTVCQTIMKLGLVGEQILLEILKNTNQNDFKLKEAVIISLRDANVKNPHIDFVLQEIFKHCKGTRVQTRICCLETLNYLRIKAAEHNQNIVYLKAKTILPFFYYFLEDPSLKIRQMATQSIFSFGGQAELIFIEGIAKGSQMVRIQSAKGLARLGIQNFRALVLGLRDEDAAVRKTTIQVLLANFSPQDVVSYYSTRTQQVPSLLCNLKDILSGNGLSASMRHFIKETILNLEKEDRNYTSDMINLNKTQNESNSAIFMDYSRQ